MNAVLNIGKYLFAIPFLVFGAFHFMNTSALAGAAFGSDILVYVTGAALIAATISMVIGKLDKLAAVLLALFLILTALLVHLNGAIEGDPNATGSFLKDIMLAGAALMYAQHVAKDKAVIG